MKNFFKQLGRQSSKLISSAARNAAKDPKKTMAGIASIVAGVGLIGAGPITIVTIGPGITTILGGIGMVLAAGDDTLDKKV